MSEAVSAREARSAAVSDHALRQQVIPWLRTYAHAQIWYPECASFDEVYALGQVLHEEGLLERTRIYATSSDEQALAAARDHESPAAVRARIIFAEHSLETDASFNEFQLIVCGDLMTRLAPPLRARAFSVCHHSLSRLGMLALGGVEAVADQALWGCYEALAGAAGLYRRVR